MQDFKISNKTACDTEMGYEAVFSFFVLKDLTHPTSEDQKVDRINGTKQPVGDQIGAKSFRITYQRDTEQCQRLYHHRKQIGQQRENHKEFCGQTFFVRRGIVEKQHHCHTVSPKFHANEKGSP